MMPKADFGAELNLPRGESRYIRLKAKGDYVKFRLAGTPFYQTDHWVGREKGPCEKYNSENQEAYCKLCEEYETAVQTNDEKVMRETRPVTTFLYPILNRETGRASIFQFTAKSIHYTISGYAREGVDVFACDWMVKRTEERGANYYSVMRLSDSSLSADEKKELKRAAEFSLGGQPSETVNPDEIPVEVNNGTTSE